MYANIRQKLNKASPQRIRKGEDGMEARFRNDRDMFTSNWFATQYLNDNAITDNTTTSDLISRDFLMSSIDTSKLDATGLKQFRDYTHGNDKYGGPNAFTE